MADFWQRMRQRKLVQWALAYAAGAFALLQGVDIVAQQFGWPDGLQRGITLVLVVGFFVTLVLAWYHGERGEQTVGGAELLVLALLLVLMSFASSLHAEDGYDLWLRYRPVAASQAAIYKTFATQLVAPRATPTQRAARDELLRGLGGLLGTPPATTDTATRDGAIVVGTPASSALVARLHLPVAALGDEG